MKHRRVSRITIHPKGLTWCNHLNGGLMRTCIPYLHWTRVGAQQQRQPILILHINIKCVLHRTRRMILVLIYGGEISPVIFYPSSICLINALGSENRFYALPSQNDGVYPTQTATSAPRQSHINGLSLEAARHLFLGDGLATLFQ